MLERASFIPGRPGSALAVLGPHASGVGLLVLGFAVVPFVGTDYWFSAVLIPFLVLSLAGLGQNLLTGYAGQLSLGSAVVAEEWVEAHDLFGRNRP